MLKNYLYSTSFDMTVSYKGMFLDHFGVALTEF